MTNNITEQEMIGGDIINKIWSLFSTFLRFSMRIKLRASRAELMWTENTPKV